jgi:predicted DNA-binding transcriptional regulator AlpA
MRKKPVNTRGSEAEGALQSQVDGRRLLINEREVSELTSTPRGTLSRWRCSGRGPSWVKLEGSVRYYLSDVLAYVEEGKRSSVRAAMEERRVAQKAR